MKIRNRSESIFPRIHFRKTIRRRYNLFWSRGTFVCHVNYRWSCLAFRLISDFVDLESLLGYNRIVPFCLFYPATRIMISVVIIICTSMKFFANASFVSPLTVYYLFTVSRGSIFQNYGLSNFSIAQKLHSAIDSRYSIYMQAYLLRSTLQYCCFEKCARGEWNIHLHVYTDRWKLVFYENIIYFHSFVSSLVVSAIIKQSLSVKWTVIKLIFTVIAERKKEMQVQICKLE